MKNTNLDMIERIEMDLEGLFWTRQDEMIEEIEELGYLVTEDNSEYVVVEAEDDEEDNSFILYIGHANSTMWIERVRAMD